MKRKYPKLIPRNENNHKHKPIEEYFLWRARTDHEIVVETQKQPESCQWCKPFNEHRLMICLHCGRKLEVFYNRALTAMIE